MKKVSEATKVDFLDYAPKLNDFGPDKIIAASGILTMKSKNFRDMLEKIDDKFLEGFHNEATRRGHASLLTSSNFYFWIEGSRMIDFYFSSFPFGSYMVFSSRRIEVDVENIVIPDSIEKSKFNSEYENVCNRLVKLYHKVKQLTGNTDYARRILPIGFISRSFVNLPLQVVLGIIKEIRYDKKEKIQQIPKEIGEIAKILECHIKTYAKYLTESSLKLPYNTNFPHPNLFKSDTNFQNFEVKILKKDENFEDLLNDMKNKLDIKIEDPKEQIEKLSIIWKDFTEKIQDKILLEVNIPSTLSAWNDYKRHRTVRQKIESIYHAVNRCLKEWRDDNFYFPPIENPEVKKEIIDAYKEALELYKKMVENGIEKRDAVYVIPHGIKLGLEMFLDGYHIFDPFGFIGIRACTTTDHEIVSTVNQIINILKNKIPEIDDLVGPKCKLEYCPEKTFCPVIKKFVRNYDENLHAFFQ